MSTHDDYRQYAQLKQKSTNLTKSRTNNTQPPLPQSPIFQNQDVSRIMQVTTNVNDKPFHQGFESIKISNTNEPPNTHPQIVIKDPASSNNKPNQASRPQIFTQSQSKKQFPTVATSNILRIEHSANVSCLNASFSQEKGENLSLHLSNQIKFIEDLKKQLEKTKSEVHSIHSRINQEMQKILDKDQETSIKKFEKENKFDIESFVSFYGLINASKVQLQQQQSNPPQLPQNPYLQQYIPENAIQNQSVKNFYDLYHPLENNLKRLQLEFNSIFLQLQGKLKVRQVTNTDHSANQSIEEYNQKVNEIEHYLQWDCPKEMSELRLVFLSVQQQFLGELECLLESRGHRKNSLTGFFQDLMESSSVLQELIRIKREEVQPIMKESKSVAEMRRLVEQPSKLCGHKEGEELWQSVSEFQSQVHRVYQCLYGFQKRELGLLASKVERVLQEPEERMFVRAQLKVKEKNYEAIQKITRECDKCALQLEYFLRHDILTLCRFIQAKLTTLNKEYRTMEMIEMQDMISEIESSKAKLKESFLVYPVREFNEEVFGRMNSRLGEAQGYLLSLFEVGQEIGEEYERKREKGAELWRGKQRENEALKNEEIVEENQFE